MRTQCPRACSAGRPHHRSMRRTPLRHNSARHMSTQCHCRARLSLPACLHSVRSAGEQNHVTVTGCPHCSSADFKIALDARGGPRGGAQHLQTTLCVPSTPRASGWRRGTRWSRLASSALERAPAARAGCRTPACARRCCALPARPVHAALHHRCRGRCQPRLPAMPGCRRRPV